MNGHIQDLLLCGILVLASGRLSRSASLCKSARAPVVCPAARFPPDNGETARQDLVLHVLSHGLQRDGLLQLVDFLHDLLIQDCEKKRTWTCILLRFEPRVWELTRRTCSTMLLSTGGMRFLDKRFVVRYTCSTIFP